MRYYVQPFLRGADPMGSGLPLDLWIVWLGAPDGPRQVAYCPRQEDAETICVQLNDAAAWADDEKDMQRIKDEWSSYDRDPPGS